MTAFVLADTSPLYAAIDRRDQYHAASQETLGTFGRSGRAVLVPDPVRLECHSLVVRRLGPADGRRWLTDVRRTMSAIAPRPDDYIEAERLLAAYQDQPLTLFDAVLAVLAARLGLPVWTYDHHFDVMRVPVWR